MVKKQIPMALRAGAGVRLFKTNTGHMTHPTPNPTPQRPCDHYHSIRNKYCLHEQGFGMGIRVGICTYAVIDWVRSHVQSPLQGGDISTTDLPTRVRSGDFSFYPSSFPLFALLCKNIGYISMHCYSIWTCKNPLPCHNSRQIRYEPLWRVESQNTNSMMHF